MIKESLGKEHLFHSDTLSNSSLVNSVKARYAHQNNKQLDLKKGDWTAEPRTARVQGSSLHLLCHVQEILSSFLQCCNKGLEQCSFSLLQTLPASVIQVGFWWLGKMWERMSEEEEGSLCFLKVQFHRQLELAQQVTATKPHSCHHLLAAPRCADCLELSLNSTSWFKLLSRNASLQRQWVILCWTCESSPLVGKSCVHQH